MIKTKNYRVGFVAILGAPNVGKSTLLNQLIGTKVSIVSPKVQTTRVKVLGIYIKNKTQIIFIDTPGIFSPKRRLDRAMVASAWHGNEDADQTLLLVDSLHGIDDNTKDIIKVFEKKNKKVILILNKIDRVKKVKLLNLAKELDRTGVISEIFMISALYRDGIETLVEYLENKMDVGPWLFPEDQVSDMPERLLAAEITREQLYLQLHQELPYTTTVDTESWENKKDGSIHIRQIILVERTSQKGIVLGKNGQRIKAIGESARSELSNILNKDIHLFLFVKVQEKWSEEIDRYKEWGLNFNA